MVLLRKAPVAGALLVIAGYASGPAAAQDAPAASLGDLDRQISRCVATPAGGAESEITILFALRRDGSLLGQPRITHSHLVGDPGAQQAFVGDAIAALAKCLPARVTEALGGAIAGRLFAIRIGGRGRQREAWSPPACGSAVA
jgi:hypothetical protein